MGKGSSRSRVRQVIGRYVYGLYRCNRAVLCRGNTFLQGANVCCQCRLIANGGRNTAQQSRYFRTSLDETENVIDKEQYVFVFFITEIFSHGEACQADTHTGSRRFVHLAIDEGRLVDNARFLHFIPKVIAFTCTFTNACEYGVTTVFCCDVMDQFHDQNGLAYTGTTEEANLAALGVRCNEVNDFDACFQDFRTCSLVFKLWYRTVDRPIVISLYFFIYFIYGLAKNVKDTSQYARANGDLDRAARIFCSHAADETVRRAHGYATDDIVAQMLHYFCYQINRLVSFAACYMDSRIDSWQIFFCRKADVDNRADNLDYFPKFIAHEEALLLI